MERCIKFRDEKSQCQEYKSLRINLPIQCESSEYPNRIFQRVRQASSKIHAEEPRTKKRLDNSEKE